MSPQTDPAESFEVEGLDESTMDFLTRRERASDGPPAVEDDVPPIRARPAWNDLLGHYRRHVVHGDTPPALEARFTRHSAELTRKVGIFLALMILGGALAFWPTDAFLIPDQRTIEVFGRVRASGVVVGGLVLLSLTTFGRTHRRGALWVVIAGFVALPGLVAWHYSAAGGLDQPWFVVSYATVPLTVMVLIRFWPRLLLTAAVAASWCGAFFLRHPEHLQHAYAQNILIFLGFVVVSSTAGGHIIYHLVRRTYFQNLRLHEQRRALAREQQRSETLLLNVLPGPVARRLKAGDQPIADGFASVTVLFADIVNFTPLAARLSPDELVELLNRIFSTFDRLADRHGLEKIKTIGDAYMIAGGLPNPRPDHARAVAEMALDMLAALEDLSQGTPELQLRVGIHSGPVVAGVIGIRKFIYDLWGDTVNIASRMESHGEAGRIQVSDATRALLGDAFALESRGAIEVKGRGAMHVWWLKAKATARTG